MPNARASRSPLRMASESTEKPVLEINRSWSNASLEDAKTIIALVLERPTTPDLARTILTYGVDRVASVGAEVEKELPQFRRDYLARLWDPVITGLRNASLRRTP